LLRVLGQGKKPPEEWGGGKPPEWGEKSMPGQSAKGERAPVSGKRFRGRGGRGSALMPEACLGGSRKA